MSKSFTNPLFRGYYKCEENDPEIVTVVLVKEGKKEGEE